MYICAGKKVWKKSGNFNFSQGDLEKRRKVREKVREFQNFPKKFIVYRLLKSIISVNCKRLWSEHCFHNSHGLRRSFIN